MKQYLDTIRKVLATGVTHENRTGVPTIACYGLQLEFPLSQGFPLVTTKQLFYRVAFNEMLCFLRGITNLKDFHKMGVHVWDKDANNPAWRNSPYRTSEGDMGAIYGQQWRNWEGKFDQLAYVHSQLLRKEDNRRLIITAWNPCALAAMCLPPCHMFMQFHIEAGTTLHLQVYIRSNDIGLGMPFNIAQYAFLLTIMAWATDLLPGTLIYQAGNYHIYQNHVSILDEQVLRPVFPLPKIVRKECDCLTDILTAPDYSTLCSIENYLHYPALAMELNT